MQFFDLVSQGGPLIAAIGVAAYVLYQVTQTRTQFIERIAALQAAREKDEKAHDKISADVADVKETCHAIDKRLIKVEALCVEKNGKK